MGQQRKDIRPEETLILPWIVGVPDYSSGVMFNFEMEYIQYREPYLYVWNHPRFPLTDRLSLPRAQMAAGRHVRPHFRAGNFQLKLFLAALV